MEEPNLNYIHQLSGGDLNFEKEIIDLIKQEFIEEWNIYTANFNSTNYSKLVDNVHKLKHKISILGLVKGYQIAANYEKNLKEGSLELSQDFDQILLTIAHYIKTI